MQHCSSCIKDKTLCPYSGDILGKNHKTIEAFYNNEMVNISDKYRGDFSQCCISKNLCHYSNLVVITNGRYVCKKELDKLVKCTCGKFHLANEKCVCK